MGRLMFVDIQPLVWLVPNMRRRYRSKSRCGAGEHRAAGGWDSMGASKIRARCRGIYIELAMRPRCWWVPTRLHVG